MFYRLKQRCWLLLVLVILGFSGTVSTKNYTSYVLASATATTIVESQTAADLEVRGRYFYSIAQFQKAISLWQQAIQIYGSQNSSSQRVRRATSTGSVTVNQARVLSNLALAYSQLGKWSQATENIAASLDLIDRPSIDSNDRIRTLAQVLNNQGIVQLRQGNIETAIATWERAKTNYQQTENELGVIRASINQSTAYKQLGFYRRAEKTLREVEKTLRQQPDSPLKISGLKSYGDILRLVGQLERSQQILEQSLAIASRLNSPIEKSEILLLLGSTYKSTDPAKAVKYYEAALKICQQQNCLTTDLPLQIYLAQLNLNLLSSNQSIDLKNLIWAIEAEFAHLPTDRANIDRKINFAYSLIQLTHRNHPQAETLAPVVKHIEIQQLVNNIVEQARQINYHKAQAYGLGLQGKILEQQEDWGNARRYTRQALILAQELNLPETSYLWQWQLARIERAMGERQEAIIHYLQAVELLQSLTKNIVAIDSEVRYSFRDSVEPVYRELVALLLEHVPGQKVATEKLEKAREVIESLQLAELNNFFREACLDTRVVNIDNLDRQAAVIYPIILSDRLEVIVSLPDRPLKHYTQKIPQQQLEVIIAKFRHNIIVRSRRNFYPPAQKLYELVMQPILDDLARARIKTLVFVPDGAFRNVPFSALYDGQKYLLEDYSIALTPGLQLLNPRPLAQQKLNTIAAGLTQKVAGFSALNYVNYELQEIENTVDSVILLNQEFTTKSLKREIESSDYPIVHIATHGQFSSSIEDTFLLAWNERIKIGELNHILQTRIDPENAIELLVLSACETAKGDNRAALGLAGMAVRAGARSTLATLWPVNDRATAKLMSNFYRQLSDKQLPKAEAIRQAQLFLLQNTKHKHPFYWAPYVLLGNWL